ncbi:unnamed protein product [Orchesella dallaii]|uniref:Exonuclease domain-containing protein n=1 Tax=Orchesella dallaii TaxID=48710 RepID=A0ABP1RI51_9HEXA
MEFLNKTLNWATYADSYDKIGFVKAFLNCLGEEELHHIKNVTQRTKAKGLVKQRRWIGPTTDEIKNRSRNKTRKPTPVQIVQTPPPSPGIVSSVPAPVLPVITPEEIQEGTERIRWWKEYKPSDFVAMDVEKVHLIHLTSVERVKAAKVTVVNDKYDVIMKKKVKHAPGTFLTNPKIVQVSGINKYDLINGSEMEEVTKEVDRLIASKYMITVAGENDFRSLNLRYNEFRVFDLQSFYRRPNPYEIDSSPMSLRDMYFYHFKEDCQPPGKPHDDETDARATMRVFREGYIKTAKFCNSNGIFDPDFSSVPNLRKNEQKGLQYCKFASSFVPIGCECVLCKQ